MRTDRIVAAVTHWLNGNPSASWDEGFCVESAVISDGRIVVELSQDTSATRIFAAFALMEISVPAVIGKSEASHGR
jgi:hypothetical protein